MQIRIGDWSEVRDCLAVDDSYETEYVWQVEERANPTHITIDLHLARLPRLARVAHGVIGDRVAEDLTQGGLLFVAEEGGIRGFLVLTRAEPNQSVLVRHIAVSPEHRRRAVGERLVQTGLAWARQAGCRIAVIQIPIKNYPAVSFFQRQGFRFSGFSDQSHANRDIVMYLSLSLR